MATTYPVTPPATGGGGEGSDLAVTTTTTAVTVTNTGGTSAVIPAVTTLKAGAMVAADKTKLDGIAASATANATDAQMRDRTTHTGAQAQSTVTNLTTDLAAKAPLASPSLTGVPTAPTATAGTSTTQLATTAFVTAAAALKQDIVGVASAFTSRPLTSADNGDNLICASAQVATVNTGLPAGFGCSFDGTITFAGSATIVDVRSTVTANPWCALTETGTNTYKVIGGKL